MNSENKNTSYYLKKFNITLKKSLGQNFLSDSAVAKRIVEKTNLADSDLVIEIGAGAGALTNELINTGKKVLAFEIDQRLENLLRERFSEFPNFELKMMDFNEFKPDEIMKDTKVSFVSNLPYHVSVPITVKIINEFPKLQNAYLMVQTEVAQRMCAIPSTKQYGSLSIFIQYHTIPKILFKVAKSHFIPNPNVESAIVEIIPQKDKHIFSGSEDDFFNFVKLGFSQRRKMIKNNYREYQPFVEDFFIQNGISQKVRAEDVSLKQFISLYEYIREREDERE